MENERKTLIKDIEDNNKVLEEFSNDSISVLALFDENIAPIKSNDDLTNLDSIVEAKRTTLRTEIEGIDSEINELNNQIITLKQEIKSFDKPLSDIQKVENKCPICQSDISEDKKNELIDMYEETISNDSKKINENNEIRC